MNQPAYPSAHSQLGYTPNPLSAAGLSGGVQINPYTGLPGGIPGVPMTPGMTQGIPQAPQLPIQYPQLTQFPQMLPFMRMGAPGMMAPIQGRMNAAVLGPLMQPNYGLPMISQGGGGGGGIGGVGSAIGGIPTTPAQQAAEAAAFQKDPMSLFDMLAKSGASTGGALPGFGGMAPSSPMMGGPGTMQPRPIMRSSAGSLY